MYIKGKGWIKLFLFLFIIISVYLGNKDFFNKLPRKVKGIIPEDKSVIEQSESKDSISADTTEENSPETLSFEFNSKKSNSFVGNFVSNTLNKILETPKGRGLVKGLLQKIMRQSQEIVGQDLFLSRYLIQDVLIGKGKEAMCGDRVDILYSILNSRSNDVHKKEMRAEIVIGGGTIGINLENGIIGMKEGGKRNIVYPIVKASQVAVHEKKQKAQSTIVNLISIKNKKKLGESLGKPFFGKVEQKYLSDIKLICGDAVKGNYVLSDLKGNVLYDSKKSKKNFSFKIGENKIPIVLSDALIGLSVHKATVSFVASSSNIKNSFNRIKNFIPEYIFSKKNNNPVILNFNLALNSRDSKVQ
ncbi:MAG: hypothetical protein HRU36_05185 [Rickettsiales bacterium]|nr:hypothetical protein [Rickettsiales bacterium]